jgi:Recombination endonuclease VII
MSSKNRQQRLGTYRRYRLKLRQSGLCVRCRKVPPLPHRIRCESCLEIVAAKNRQSEARRRQDAAYRLAYNARKYEYLTKRKQDTEYRRFHSLQFSLIKYGLTLDSYHAKYEAQDFCCAVCGTEGPQQAFLFIDHNHMTQRTRGLLCNACNAGIGHLKESAVVLGQAQAYLQQWENRHESI